MSSLKKRKLRLDRTLGPLVIQWIEDNLCHGPGDVQGQPIMHDDEEVEFIMRAYEIDDRGNRVVRRAVLSRAKGRRKSELAAELVCAEALGPVRFAGWDHDGKPLGMNVQNPIIRVVATEENQSDNAYVPVQYMLTEGPIAEKVSGVDVGMTRTLLPGGGKIAPITAKASSKDGGRETFVVFDETHLYNKPELRNLHATLRRNLAKRKAAQPWSLETSTMYAPGEDSVAEGSHRYYEAIIAGSIKDPGFLFDHRQGPSKFDFDDDEQLRAALIQAYGAASEWMDIERLILEARDPQTDKGDFLRYFVNIPSERYEGKWISDEAWRACQVDTEIPAGAEVVVAADAAHSRDTSALVWTWVSPNGRLVQRSRVWSCLPNSPHDVFVPGGRLDNDLLRDYILEYLCGEFSVILALADPMYFNDQIREIAEAGITVFEMIQGSSDMREAWDEFYGNIYSGRRPRLGAPRLSAPGGEIYAKHIRNAVGVKTERGWRVSKKTAISPIDCVAAGAMSAWGSERIEELAYTSGGVLY